MRDIAILTKIAIEITSNNDFDLQMNRVLKIIGDYLQISRAYIFLNDEKEDTFSNRYEWCNEGVASKFNNNKRISYDSLPSILDLFNKEGRIKAENTDLLPKDLSRAMKSRDILSVAAYPIRSKSKFYGFLSFEECDDYKRWYSSEMKILEALSILLANEFEKREILKKIKRYKDDFQLFFDTIEDFIIITDMKGKIIEANKYVLEVMGFTLEELREKIISELHYAKNIDVSEHLLEQALSNEKNVFSLEFISKTGRKIYVDTRTWIGKWNKETSLFIWSKNVTKEKEALYKFSKLFDSNPSIMSVSTVPEGRIVDINQAFADRLDYRKEDVIGRTADEIGIIIQNVDVDEKTKEFHESGKISNENIRIVTNTGKIIDGLISGEIIETSGQLFYLTVMIDISEQIKIQNLYDTEKTRLKSLIDSARLGTWEWNICNGDINYNDKLLSIIGYSREEIGDLKMKEWMKWVHEDDLLISKSLIKKNFSKELPYYEFDCRLRHKNGYYIWVNNRGKIIEWDKNGKPMKMYGTYSDITEKKLIENKLKEVSIRDYLTNIYNRKYIYERMRKDIFRAERENLTFSVAILDIDRFKNINDRFGHITGDFILKEFTKDISKELRPYDLLGRFGGEEFIIILYDSDKTDSHKVISRILQKIRSKTYSYQNNDIRFTFSAGISDIYEIEGDVSNEKLIELADERLYKAKRTGRNKIVFF